MRALLILLLAALPAAAGTTVTLRRGDGTPVAQGEVCRFAAGDRVNPFKRWLASQDVTCAPVTAQVEFPKGLWNVFARTGDAVSTAPVLVDGDAAPQTLSLTIEKATTIAPQLTPGQKGVVYAPRRATAWPVEKERTTVPADEELWLFVLEKNKLVGMMPQASVIGWLQIPDSDRAALETASGVLTPTVRATSGAVTREADLLPPLPLLHGAFVRVRDVPAGNADLRVEGRWWIRERQSVKVQESALNIVKEPLTLRLGGTLTVHWSSESDLEALDRSLGACSDDRSGVPQVKIIIHRCPSAREIDTCALVHEAELDPRPRFGSVTLDDIPPGTYRAEMRFGKLPPESAIAGVGPLQLREIRLHPFYLEAYGSVTLGGEPLGEDVRIRFPAGYGFAPRAFDGFAPRDSEEYSAVLRALVGKDAQVMVEACDGSPRAIVLTDEPMRRSTRFNLDIPANELTINVSDTFTRDPLRGATVEFEVMSLDKRRAVMQGKLMTDSNGIASMQHIPLRELRLTVSFPGYQKQRIEPFSLTELEKKTIDIQLVPLRGNNGKIISEHLFDSAAVIWYSPGGRETERADLAPDGTFIYANWHAPDETMTVVSASHPLWVVRSPDIGRRETITLRFPDAPVRAFAATVETSDLRSSWWVGLAIGGLRVPQPVLELHQKLRREQTLIQARARRVFRDLLATGPLDVFLEPPYGGTPTRLAAEATEVVLTPAR